MKKSAMIACFLILVILFFIRSNKANNFQSNSGSIRKETYISKVIIDAPWGEEPGQFGIYKPPEGGPRVGPETYVIAQNDDIYVDDQLNGRIQKFNNNGQFISSISLSFSYENMYVEQSGNIYLYHTARVPKRIIQYDNKGNLSKEYPILWDDLGMRVVGGAYIYSDNSGRLFLCYRSDSLKVPMIFQVGTTEMVFSPEQQKATLREGFVGSNNVVLNQGKIFQSKEGELRLVEFDSTVKKTGKSDKEFSLYRLNLYPFGVAGFTGVDNEMNVYTTQGNTIRKYNPAGDLVAEFNIEKDDYAHTSRAIVLDEHGNIFVMSTSKEGLKIIKWSPVEGKK